MKGETETERKTQCGLGLESLKHHREHVEFRMRLVAKQRQTSICDAESLRLM